MLSDAIWQLTENCWAKIPKDRPIASELCDALSYLLGTTITVQSVSDPSPSHPPAQASPPSAPPNLTIMAHASSVSCATFSPNGKYIVSGSVDCTIRVWDAQTGECILSPPNAHSFDVCAVAFSPNGRYIASGSIDTTILLWDASSGTIVSGPFKCSGLVYSVSLSPDGNKITSSDGFSEGVVQIWDARTGTTTLGPIKGHTHHVRSVVFSEDGRRVASGSYDRTINVWDTEFGGLVQGPMRGHKSAVCFIGFSLDGKTLVSADSDQNVCVWNVDTGALVSGPSKRHPEGTLAVAFSASGSMYTLAVSPDGKWIAGKDGNRVHAWDSTTGQRTATLEEHADYVTSVTFSPDSRRILSTSFDNTIRVKTLDCQP
jgi:WD40 repeat protein